jgi:DNA-binding LacI/PurR family transcriptional regulator
MNRSDILNVITDLSYSQGFYGRLLRAIKEEINELGYSSILDELEAQNFNNSLDMILYLEC